MNSGQDRCWHALLCCILLYSVITKTLCHVSVPSWNAHILLLLLPKYSKANSFKLNHDFGHHTFYEFLPCQKRLLWCAHDFSQTVFLSALFRNAENLPFFRELLFYLEGSPETLALFFPLSHSHSSYLYETCAGVFFLSLWAESWLERDFFPH